MTKRDLRDLKYRKVVVMKGTPYEEFGYFHKFTQEGFFFDGKKGEITTVGIVEMKDGSVKKFKTSNIIFTDIEVPENDHA